ncbi:HEAT repeat domain-containing protein [candidate division WOR-3 bacterium]|nr:HEAT repeat domain-containing protein [candidate division WOR-3 bacterium]
MIFLTTFFLPFFVSSTDLTVLDSLFVRASVGRYDWIELNEPARESFARMEGDYVLDFLTSKLKHASAREFLAITEIFKIMGIRTRERLLSLMENEDEDLKISAVYISGEMEDSFLINRASNLSQDENWRVRANVARILGNSCDPFLIPVIKDMLDDFYPTVRLNALVSLGKFDDLPFDVLLRTADLLCDSNLFVREKAVEILLIEDSISAEILLQNSDFYLDESRDQFLVFFMKSSHSEAVKVLESFLTTASDIENTAVSINLKFYNPDLWNALENFWTGSSSNINSETGE